MAYRPTRQRQYKINPVPIVPMTGLKNLGASFNSVANDVAAATKEIDDSIEKQQLDAALLQAQGMGKAQGAVYENDVDGVPTLQPFLAATAESAGVNLAGLRNSSIAKVNAAFSEAYGTAFQSAIIIDARKKAQASYSKNKNNPGQVNADFNAYLEQLSDTHTDQGAKDLIAQIDFDIASLFQGVGNQALHNQQELVRDETKKTSLEALTIISEEKAKIISTHALDTPNVADRAKERLATLDSRAAKIYETLKTVNSFSDSDIANLERSNRTQTQINVIRTDLENTFRKDGDAAAFAVLTGLQDTLKGESRNEFDVKTLLEAAESTYQNLSSQAALDKKAITTAQAADYDLVQLLIKRGDITNKEQLTNYNLSNGQLTNALYQLDNTLETAKAKARTDRNQRISTAINYYLAPEYDPEKRSQAEIKASILEIWKENPDEQQGNLVKFLVEEKKMIIKGLEAKGEGAIRPIQALMRFGPALHPPSTFENLTKQLIERGTVGDTNAGAAITIEEWASWLDKYKTKYKKQAKENGVLTRVSEAHSQNKPIEDKHFNWMMDNGYVPMSVNGKPLSLIPSEGTVDTGMRNDPTVPISSAGDENHARQSADIALGWMVQNLYMHPAAKSLLTGTDWINDDVTYRASIELHNQLQRSLMNKFNGNEWMVNKALKHMGINTSILNADTRYKSMKETLALANKDFNPSRAGGDIYPKRNPGDDKSAQMSREEVLKDVLSEDDVPNLLMDVLSQTIGNAYINTMTASNEIELRPEHQKMFDDFKFDGMSVHEAILSDGGLVNIIFDKAEADIMNGEYFATPTGLKLAIKDNMVDLMSEMGLQRDIDGNVELVRHPIIQEAQKTAAGFSNVAVMNDDIIQNTKELVMAIPSLFPNESLIKDAISEGKFIYTPNTIFGKDPTYSVYVETDDGQRRLLLPQYRYDFLKSAQYEAYKTALDQIKHPGMKRFMASLPLLDDTVMKSTYESVNEYQRSEEMLAPLIRAYNRAGYAMFDNFNPADVGQDDMEVWTDYMMTLGISGMKLND